MWPDRQPRPPTLPHQSWDFGIRRKLIFFSLSQWNLRPGKCFLLKLWTKTSTKGGYHQIPHTLSYGPYWYTFLFLLSTPLDQFNSKFVIGCFWWYASTWGRKHHMKNLKVIGSPTFNAISEIITCVSTKVTYIKFKFVHVHF